MGSNHVQSRRDRIRIYAGAKSERFHASDQLLRAEISGRSWSERASTESAGSRVEGAYVEVEGFLDICQRRSGGVMEMQRQLINRD